MGEDEGIAGAKFRYVRCFSGKMAFPQWVTRAETRHLAIFWFRTLFALAHDFALMGPKMTRTKAIPPVTYIIE